jgi:hypothetical protein
MAALDAYSDVRGPMVVGDANEGDVVLSFEFLTVGELNADVRRALEIAIAAMDT